jgi:hypothetical protein
MGTKSGIYFQLFLPKPLPFADPVSNYRPRPGFPRDHPVGVSRLIAESSLGMALLVLVHFLQV